MALRVAGSNPVAHPKYSLRVKDYKSLTRKKAVPNVSPELKRGITAAWFSKDRKYIEVFNLPPYYPELNGAEKIWWHTRSCATHNRYCDTVEVLCAALGTTFDFLINKSSKILQLFADFL